MDHCRCNNYIIIQPGNNINHDGVNSRPSGERHNYLVPPTTSISIRAAPPRARSSSGFRNAARHRNCK